MTIFFGLGVTGRLGNQIVEYSICKYLEYIHSIDIYYSQWIGEEIFEAKKSAVDVQSLIIRNVYVDNETYSNDLILRLKLESLPEEKLKQKKRFIKVGPSEYFLSTNFDCREKTVFHYPRVNFKWLIAYKSELQSQLQLKPMFQTKITNIKNQLCRDKKLVVLHIRRGDFNLMLNPYFVFITKFYSDWLDKNFDSQTMILYVCGQGNASDKKTFSKYKPAYLEDVFKLDPTLTSLHRYADLILDHGLMRIADYVLISNSSFSFTACLHSANTKALFYKPAFEKKSLIKFDPWQSYSYDLCRFGINWIYYYLKYRPGFGIIFIWQLIKMIIKGERIRNFSYT